jgi:hypothetical protein
MKKIFFIMAVLCTMVAFGQQYSARDILIGKLIHQNMGLNPHISNPDLIFPNDPFFFSFQSGFDTTLIVEKGNTLTSLVDMLLSLEEEHGPIVVGPTQSAESEKQSDNSAENLDRQTEIPWWAFLIMALIVSWIFYNVFVRRSIGNSAGRFSENPATEGIPFVEGGVRSENVENHFVDLALRDNPGLDRRRVEVKGVQKKYVSTPGGKSCRVRFADGTSQLLSFRNTPGWTAMVSVDGGKTFERQVYFEECGNPLQFGKGMKAEDLILSDTPISFGDEPIQTQNEVLEKPVVEEAIDLDKTIKELESILKERLAEGGNTDVATVSRDQAAAADEFFKTQKAHRATLRFERRSDGSVVVESVFETKNPPTKDKKNKKV